MMVLEEQPKAFPPDPRFVGVLVGAQRRAWLSFPPFWRTNSGKWVGASVVAVMSVVVVVVLSLIHI